jgi:hypothetical protein
MSELDPRLAELLRRSPPPAALDEAHRAAVHTAARQAWFRQQAQRRRMNLGFAAAACLMAGLAGWALHAGLDVPQNAAAPVVAIHETDERAVGLAAAAPAPASAPPPSARAELHDDSDLRGAGPSRQRTAGVEQQKDLGAATGNAIAPPAPAAAAEPAMAGAMARAPAAPATFAAADAMVAESKEDVPRADQRTAKAALAMPVAATARKTAPSPISVPEDAPERGRLLAAAAVLDAALNHRLEAADRLPAVQTALASLDGIVHPAADDLRRRLRNAIQLP